MVRSLRNVVDTGAIEANRSDEPATDCGSKLPQS
jgi:hypothetical protein